MDGEYCQHQSLLGRRLDITGHTKLFPIIGVPVSGVVSPPAINAWFAENGVDARMVPLDVPDDAVSAFWQLIRSSESFLGCSITFPHKQSAFREADQRTDRAERLNALNTLRRGPHGQLAGDATDGLALLRALQDSKFDAEGCVAHVVGAGGGAGRAIVDALCGAGISGVILEDFDLERLEETRALVARHWPQVDGNSAPGSADFLVDATPNGKDPAAPPLFSEDGIANCRVACDIAGTHATSQLLREAGSLGKTVVDATAVGRGQVEVQMAFVLGCE